MAKIENRSERALDIHGLPKGGTPGALYSIPRFSTGENDVRVNSVIEIPDDVLSALLAGDPWTKSLFDAGELAILPDAPAAPAAPPAETGSDDKATKTKDKAKT
jgi:hypothetical protein